MPRKTHFKRGKRGAKSRRAKSTSRVNRTQIHKSRKYRGRGGCENDSCSLSGSALPSAPLWFSKGGCTINKDIYDHRTDGTFYSAAK